MQLTNMINIYAWVKLIILFVIILGKLMKIAYV